MEQEIKENEEKKKAKSSAFNNAYTLLSSVKEGHDLTLRDDQFDFSSLLDAVKICRRKGLRIRLVDSGLYDRFQLEWLLDAGADFYTSDDIPRDFQELEGLQQSCLKGGSILAFFQHKQLGSSDDSEPLAFSGLQELARGGIYLHITNREMERDLIMLSKLAEDCLASGSRLIYYHHGPFVPGLEELGRSRAWIHISDKSIQSEKDHVMLMDLVRSLRSSGTNLVLYLERGMDYLTLQDIVDAGGFVLFKTAQIDYRSPLKKLERAAAKKKLDFRAYYLYPTFLP